MFRCFWAFSHKKENNYHFFLFSYTTNGPLGSKLTNKLHIIIFLNYLRVKTRYTTITGQGLDYDCSFQRMWSSLDIRNMSLTNPKNFTNSITLVQVRTNKHSRDCTNEIDDEATIWETASRMVEECFSVRRKRGCRKSVRIRETNQVSGVGCWIAETYDGFEIPAMRFRVDYSEKKSTQIEAEELLHQVRRIWRRHARVLDVACSTSSLISIYFVIFLSNKTKQK